LRLEPVLRADLRADCRPDDFRVDAADRRLEVLFFRVPPLPLLVFFRPDDLRPLPDFLPPPSCLLTVAQARRSASFFDTPRFS
jgi:hypothetical protein